MARAPPFPFSEFVFALQSFSGQSQLLTCCYIVVVIPHYLSLGWVGGKGGWEEEPEGLGLLELGASLSADPRTCAICGSS